MESKPWYASKTLWVNAIAVVLALVGAFGIDIDVTPETQAALVGGIMAVVNIVLRLTTTTAVGG